MVTYLIGALICLAIWLYFWSKNKSLRKELLIIGLIFALDGLLMGYLAWTKDWWKPPTITGTTVGIEDLIFGFSVSGIAAVLYITLFDCKLKNRGDILNKEFILIILLNLFLVLILTIFMNSFYATSIASIIPIVYIISLRKDLLAPSFKTGILGVIISIPIYKILQILDSSIFDWWIKGNLLGIDLWQIPIEDLIWFFLVGMFMCSLFLYWQNLEIET